MAYDYDVIVIGSGVAGALVAWKIVSEKPGCKLLILEAGKNGLDHAQRREFHSAMLANVNRGDMHAPYAKLASRQYAPVPDAVAEQAGGPKYFDQRGPDLFKAQYLRQVGGSTWSWRGNTPRFVPNDFRLKEVYGVGEDWPKAITYDTLEPFYLEAERHLGVSGDTEEWRDPITRVFGKSMEQHLGKRSQPFPMSPIVFSSGDAQMGAELNKQVVELEGHLLPVRVFHTPQARTSRAYRPDPSFEERPACEGNSNCIPLCPIGAKYDASVHLRQALRLGVVLQEATVVTRLARDADNPALVTQVFYKRWDSDDIDAERVVTAKTIVVAANAIETPKLLLLSNVANSSERVGSYLMDHLQDDITLFFPRPLYPFRGPQSLASIEVFRDGPFRGKHSAIRMTVGNDGAGRAPGRSISDVLANLLAKNTFGKPLHHGLEDTLSRLVRIGFSTEMLPDEANRVELSNNLRDSYGIPRPELHFKVGNYTYDGLRKGHELALALARGIPGIDQSAIEELEWKKKFNTAAHIMGTCRMGDDPKTSVVNADGRSHDVPNLYVAGSSVFTTSGTANPTLTLAALALRTAANLAKGV
ncbi:MAG: GMC family oxidoreductase [Planctomycetes bacterium]|nr:GMC family oxidoreductase [Planctomycetota bacterium]